MRPDKPGEWHARDGRKVLVNYLSGKLTWRTSGDPARIFGGSKQIIDLEGDDWLPAIAPTFPELPPKPRLVLFTQRDWGPGENFWGTVGGNVLYVVSPKEGHGATYDLKYAKIEIVPHPDNDHETVQLIQRAKT